MSLAIDQVGVIARPEKPAIECDAQCADDCNPPTASDSSQHENTGPDQVKLFFQRERPKMSSSASSKIKIPVKQNGRSDLRKRSELKVFHTVSKQQYSEISPSRGHQPEQPVHVKALEAGAFEQLRCDEKSAQHEKDGHSVLPCLRPGTEIAPLQGILGMIEKYQQDGETAPTV